MKSTANLVRRSCITLHCRQQTIFMLKRGWRHVSWEWHPKSVFSSNQWRDRSFAHCVLSHDDVIASGAWYIAANLKKRRDSLRFCFWLTNNYSYIKLYTFLVILIPHLSPIVGFELGKNSGEFSKWRLACIPVSFYNSQKGPRPKWPRPQVPVVRVWAMRNPFANPTSLCCLGKREIWQTTVIY